MFFFQVFDLQFYYKKGNSPLRKKYITVFLALIFPNNFQWFKKVVGKIEGLTSCWSYIWNLLFLYYYLKLKTHCCANFCTTKYIFGYFDWSIKESSKWKHIINRLKGRTLLGRGKLPSNNIVWLKNFITAWLKAHERDVAKMFQHQISHVQILNLWRSTGQEVPSNFLHIPKLLQSLLKIHLLLQTSKGNNNPSCFHGFQNCKSSADKDWRHVTNIFMRNTLTNIVMEILLPTFSSQHH